MQRTRGRQRRGAGGPMKVWVLRNPDGSFRARFHRHDAFDCPGRRRYEETYPDRGDYVLVDISELPPWHPACQFHTCFAGQETAGDVREPGDRGTGDKVSPRAQASSKPGGITVGQVVECEDLESGERITWTVVDGASDPAAGKVAAGTAIGKALLGRRPSDTAVIKLPRGERRVRIVATSTPTN